jgi:Transposase DDE domain
VITIDALANQMQSVLSVCLDEIGKRAGFVQRRSKLTPSLFVKTLVFGWLSHPEATLEELAQTAGILGVPISAQGLDQRFTPEAAQTLRGALDTMMVTAVGGERPAIPLLNRFKGVYIRDSSIVSLPEALKNLWPGAGGSTPSAGASALKFQVTMNLADGQLDGPLLTSAKVNDKTAASELPMPPKGSLHIADLGYFVLPQMAEMSRQGVYWLSRLNMRAEVLDESGELIDLPAALEKVVEDEIDIPVLAGKAERASCRLIGLRVPSQVATERRRKMREEARKRGRSITPRRLALADWTLMLTNILPDKLSGEEARVLYQARWQIELLFKQWKSYGKIDRWRSRKPMRILCEVYAKLIAMTVQHWILVTSCWAYADRSLMQATATVRRMAFTIARDLHDIRRLRGTLTTIRNCLAHGCRIHKRRKNPGTSQLLLDPQILRERPANA